MTVTLQTVPTLKMQGLHALLVSFLLCMVSIVEDIVVCIDIHPLYLKGVHMVTSDWEVVPVHKVEWRCVWVEIGVLCVMMDGQQLMLMWPVDSLDFQDLVSSCQGFCNYTDWYYYEWAWFYTDENSMNHIIGITVYVSGKNRMHTTKIADIQHVPTCLI